MPRVLKVAISVFIGTFAVGLILQLIFGIPQQFVLIGGTLIFFALIVKELLWCVRPTSIKEYTKGNLSVLHMIGLFLGWTYFWGLIILMLSFGFENSLLDIPIRVIILAIIFFLLSGVLMKIFKALKK